MKYKVIRSFYAMPIKRNFVQGDELVVSNESGSTLTSKNVHEYVRCGFIAPEDEDAHAAAIVKDEAKATVGKETTSRAKRSTSKKK